MSESTRDLDAVLQAIQPELTKYQSAWRELVADRADASRRVGWVALIGAGIAAVLGGVTQSAVVLAIGMVVVALVAGGVYWSLVVSPEREMAAMIGNDVISAVVRAMEPEMTFSPRHGIPESAFTASGLFKRPDRYRTEDGLAGRIGETDVMISEVHAEERHESRDSKGNRRVHYTTLFRGVFMVADFHKHFQGTTRVLPDTAESLFGGLGRALQSFRPFSSEELVYLEDPDFESRFVVYSTDQIEARYILSTSMARRILELRERWDDDVRLSFVADRVCVAITHGRDLLEPEVRDGTLDRGEIERLVAELGVCFDLVEDLNLNTRIWTKE